MIDPESHFDLIGIAVRAMVSGWEHTDGIRHVRAEGVAVRDAHDEGIPATLDGEPCTLPPYFEVSLIANAARVISFTTAE
jgi:diacylglycerol kinase family enzyme